MYCEKCKEYTMKEKCPKCRGKTIVRKPAKFSKDKDYSLQRLKTKGLL